MDEVEDAAVLAPLISATRGHAPPQEQHQHNAVPQYNPASQDPPQAETPSTFLVPPPPPPPQPAQPDGGQGPAPEHQPGEGTVAMTTQEALRMYAPQQKIRDKIVADHKKGLGAEHVASKHGVAPSTVRVVIKRYQEAERAMLSKSTRWRYKKKAEAEEAARKAAETAPGDEDLCGEPDFVKMANQGACVACTVKFQTVALGRPERSGANVKRSRTQFGCRNCKVHLCRKGYCWDIFHKHAKG